MPIRRHLRGIGLSGVEDISTGTSHNYHQDEQGSTAYVTGTNGETENLYSYDGFGNIIESKEDITNRILYTGQQYDQETGQYYLRARYYNPVIGRFTQEDTYRGDGLNLYAYCDNNPVIYYDSSGYGKASNGGCTDNSNKKQDETPGGKCKWRWFWTYAGEKGTQVSSQSTWKNGSTERIDVENPAPGQRLGQVHYHDANNNKYYYDINNNKFYNQKTGELAPNKIQKLTKYNDFMKGIKKALKILGE